jgi:hypothetical protein
MDIKDCKPGTKVVIISKTSPVQNSSYEEWKEGVKTFTGKIYNVRTDEKSPYIVVDTVENDIILVQTTSFLTV